MNVCSKFHQRHMGSSSGDNEYIKCHGHRTTSYSISGAKLNTCLKEVCLSSTVLLFILEEAGDGSL